MQGFDGEIQDPTDRADVQRHDKSLMPENTIGIAEFKGSVAIGERSSLVVTKGVLSARELSAEQEQTERQL
jgi:hypothetical protein